MLFNSLRFVLFAAAVIGAYHLVRRWRWQNALLLAASVAFYLTWDNVGVDDRDASR